MEKTSSPGGICDGDAEPVEKTGGVESLEVAAMSDWLLGRFGTFHKTQVAFFRSITKHLCPWTQRIGAQNLDMG